MEIAQEIKWTSIKSKCKLFNFQYMTDLTHIYQQLPLFDYKSAKNSYPRVVLTVFSYIWGMTTALTHIGSKCFLRIWSDTTAVTLIGSKCFESRETTT